MTDERHSAQFLTDVRALWWNRDFLSLIAQRLQLADVRCAVDVGSGHGHWTRTLAQVLPQGAAIVGVEREPAWVDVARAGPPAEGVSLSFVQGTAERLPFADGSQDLVTCQTLLIHVAEPALVLAEMARVLRPGGLLLVAEPNNVAGSVVPFASPETDIDDLVAWFRLEVTCEKGKHALGLGYNSLGEGLVGLLPDTHWSDVRAWLCDKTRVARAPYSAEALQMLDDERRQLQSGAVGWPLEETRRFYDAGGGDPILFDALWTRARRLQERRFAAVDAGRYAALEGSPLYLIAARRR